MVPDDLLRTEAEARAAALSELSYAVELDLTGEPSAGSFSSTVEARFRAVPGTATFIDLEAERVRELVLNGEPQELPSVADNRIALAGLREQNVLRVVADCRYSHVGMGLHRAVDPVDGHTYLHSQAEPFEAHRIFACFDQPDLKASIALRVAVPAEWVAVSNGPRREESVEGAVRHVEFAASPLMSTYLFAIVAGPFEQVSDQHGDLELNLYCRRSLRRFLDEAEIFEVTKQGLDHFSARFGMEYPFPPKYDQLFVPEFNAGAMENVACVTFNEDSTIFRGPVPARQRAWRAGTILHEMAHMWFGDLVTMRWWDDLWLNESFATYMGNDAQFSATRFTSAWIDFANTDKSWAASQDQMPTTHPVAATEVPDVSTGKLNFDGISYAKGASVLRQLVAWVGEDSFYAGLREYFREHRWRNTTLADFLAPLERHSGRDLDAWAREWLRTAGMNVLRPAISGDTELGSLAVLQEPAVPSLPTLRSHRIGIGLYDLEDGRLVRTGRLDVDISGARTEVPQLAGRPRPALVLLNDGDLTFAKLRLDDRSAQTVLDHLGDLEDGLARSLLWAAMWDMTRDAELSASRYLDLVERHAVREPLPTVLDGVLAQAQGAVEVYAAPSHRRELRARLLGVARGVLEHAPRGSATQLTAFRTLVAGSERAEDLRILRAMLDGEGVPPGITLDQDLRWSLVRRLAGSGEIGVDVIDAEAARDGSDRGLRHAAAARAARPLAEAKEEAWQRLVAPDTPLATQRALMGGLQDRDQEELYAPYVERWAATVPRYWRERSQEEAEDFTARVFPRYLVDDSVIAVVDRLLGEGSLSDPARRLVMENRDSALRTLRARAADADPVTEAKASA